MKATGVAADQARRWRSGCCQRAGPSSGLMAWSPPVVADGWHHVRRVIVGLTQLTPVLLLPLFYR